MPRSPRVRAGLLAALLATGCLTLAGCAGDDAPTPPLTRTAATFAPGPTAVAAPGVLAAPVPRGTVGRAAGPFDDRFDLEGTRLAADGVHTRLTVTSDVSDILALEVSAAFYDAAGQLLGTGRVVRGEQHDETGAHVPDESLDLLVPAAPAYAARVASAVLSVPVLVNE